MTKEKRKMKKEKRQQGLGQGKKFLRVTGKKSKEQRAMNNEQCK